MENLNLTYREVVDVIPYRNLIIMQKDKQHTVSGIIRQEVTEDKFFEGRKSKLG